MEPLVTNIFAVMGKPGAGKSTLIKNVLSKETLVNRFNLTKLVYGTTRPMNPYDIEGNTYHFYTLDEYENIDPDDIIESRSYDIIYTGETQYYFTLKSHIKFGTNYIAQISAFQYDELKKWAFITQLKNSMVQINIYPIMINAAIFEREKRLMNKASNEQDVYDMCGRIITEKYEFNSVISNNPELIDPSNPDTCIIDNSSMGRQNIALISNQVEKFISNKLILQGSY